MPDFLPLLVEAMHEHKDGETEADVFFFFGLLVYRIASSLDGLSNQSHRGQGVEMLRRHQAMWSGHLGDV